MALYSAKRHARVRGAWPVNLTYSPSQLAAIYSQLTPTATGTTGSGDTVYANSLSYADVMYAYGNCDDGDTLILPSGNETWSSSQRWTIAKPIILMGAGSSSTIITTNYNSGYSYAGPDDYMYSLAYQPSSPSSNPAFRMSGIRWNFSHLAGGMLLKNTSGAQYPCTRIRIDHCILKSPGDGYEAWHGAGGFVLIRSGSMWGVIDNSTIQGVMDHIGGTSGWTYDPYYFGSQNQFYIEDSIWTWATNSCGICHAGNGANRYGIRHNAIVVDCTTLISPLLDEHGNHNGAMGSLGAEVYENIISSPLISGKGVGFDQRGGKWLVYNNTFNNNVTCWMRVREEQNDANEGYPFHLISGQPQHPSDSYYWGNYRSGVLINADDTGEHYTYDGHSCPEENYHFWNQDDSFNGSAGIGVGLLSARPSSGLTVGVGYWATDTQTLYRATSSTTWEAYFTPYTYPHPLRSDPILGD